MKKEEPNNLMQVETFAELINQLKQDEGFRSKIYNCSEGYPTIGYGLNLESGITEKEASILLEFRVMNIMSDLSRFTWFHELDEVRKTVIANMVYQMGLTGVLRFKKMIKAIRNKNYKEAAGEMMDSKWFQQTESRSRRLATIMEDGKFTDKTRSRKEATRPTSATNGKS